MECNIDEHANNSELGLKCLNHLVFGGEETKRVILPTENPPENVKSWKPGHLCKVFQSLGIEVEDFSGSSSSSAQTTHPNSAWITSKKQAEIQKVVNGEKREPKSPPIRQQVKAAPLRSRLAGLSTFNPPRRVSPVKSEEKEAPVPVVNLPATRDNRIYSQSTSKKQLSLYDTYEDRNSRQASSQKAVQANRSQPQRVPELPSSQGRDDGGERDGGSSTFRTAHQQLVINDRQKGIKRTIPSSASNNVHVSGLKKVARYEPPPPAKKENEEEPISDNPEVVELMQNPLLKNIDPKMVEAVLNEVMDAGSVDWHDIAGLEGVKNIIKEIILKPMLRPDIFTGLRAPPKGILLFGPPGTGKTMIGRLIATRSKFSFFNISASSLTSKWIGDGEKMVRALFAVARAKQPAVVFIDEIDSILTQRSDTEHESSRRLKTEFLCQFEGCATKSEDRILIIGVTNRPRELDDAARRRFVKRIYIPLPDAEGRKQLVRNLIKGQTSSLQDADYDRISEMTDGYSGADMATLCQEAAYGPIRDSDVDIENIRVDEVRPINLGDFETAMELVKPSVDPSDLAMYEEFDRQFGCKAVKPKAT